MTPTPTQIKAAAKAIEAIEPSFPNEFEAAAKAALTAAAQVGETFDDGYKYKEAECRDEIAATIERCAQVAESTTYMSGAHIAAAIRKLKDET